MVAPLRPDGDGEAANIGSADRPQLFPASHGVILCEESHSCPQFQGHAHRQSGNILHIRHIRSDNASLNHPGNLVRILGTGAEHGNDLLGVMVDTVKFLPAGAERSRPKIVFLMPHALCGVAYKQVIRSGGILHGNVIFVAMGTGHRIAIPFLSHCCGYFRGQ